MLKGLCNSPLAKSEKVTGPTRGNKWWRFSTLSFSYEQSGLGCTEQKHVKRDKMTKTILPVVVMATDAVLQEIRRLLPEKGNRNGQK